MRINYPPCHMISKSHYSVSHTGASAKVMVDNQVDACPSGQIADKAPACPSGLNYRQVKTCSSCKYCFLNSWYSGECKLLMSMKIRYPENLVGYDCICDKYEPDEL